MDTQGIYVFAFRRFHLPLLQHVDTLKTEGLCGAEGEGTWLCHSNMICGSKSSSSAAPDLQAWSVPQPVRQPGQT